MSDCVDELRENEDEIFKAACDTLLRVSSNILKSPKETKFRSVKLTSVVITTKLMIAAGGMECLFAMGFKESPTDSEALVLPMDDSLDELKKIHDQIERMRHPSGSHGGGDSSSASRNSSAPSSSQTPAAAPSSVASPTSVPAVSAAAASVPTATPPISAALLRSELSFRRRLESGIQTARSYEDPRLQAKALACVPLDRMKAEAKTLMESVSSTAVVDSTAAATAAVAPDVGFEDCLMLLLIRWFKREFFKWVNQPNCENCEGKTVGSGMGTPSDAESLWGAGRVELYKCSTCTHVTRFPRYNNPGKLLETRRGRCGEWANCFALISRACGFETRYVLDWTDHVWTEYFSKSQGRWVHGDTCEEGHDKPLLYEHGWGKKLTYVIAFSVDDIQDVTWRYTTKQSDVLKRRNEIRENVLVSTIMQMKMGLQASLLGDRKNELLRRTVKELSEFLGCDQRIVAKGELSGRQSGSLSWRLSRGETGAKQLPMERETQNKTQLVPTKREIDAKRFNLKYFPVKDIYQRELGDETSSKSWDSLTFENENLETKAEQDWRMSYLARRPNCGEKTGSISWRLNLKEAGIKMKKLELLVTHQLFENGKLDFIICCDGSCQKISLASGQTVPFQLDLEGSEYLELKAVLSGGSGSNAWQHSQLFRSSMDSLEAIGLDLTVYFQ